MTALIADFLPVSDRQDWHQYDFGQGQLWFRIEGVDTDGDYYWFDVPVELGPQPA